MASIIVADASEGRRNLLAGTLERENYSVTRASTLRQCEATALATMPDVVLMDGQWSTGDALDSCNRLQSDPEFVLKCRIVLLSNDTTNDFLVSATQGGVAEVLEKPVDMNRLLLQVSKHAAKQFVPPPAEVEAAGGQGYFSVQLQAGDPSWALPIIRDLLGQDVLDESFIKNVVASLDIEDEELVASLSPEIIEKLLRNAFDQLILGEELPDEPTSSDGDSESEGGEPDQSGERKVPQRKKSKLEHIFEQQAALIESQLESSMQLLDEEPERVALLTEENGLVPIDPDVLNLTRRSTELIIELLWELGVPGRLADLTYSSRVEEAIELAQDILDCLPAEEDADSQD